MAGAITRRELVLLALGPASAAADGPDPVKNGVQIDANSDKYLTSIGLTTGVLDDNDECGDVPVAAVLADQRGECRLGTLQARRRHRPHPGR